MRYASRGEQDKFMDSRGVTKSICNTEICTERMSNEGHFIYAHLGAPLLKRIDEERFSFLYTARNVISFGLDAERDAGRTTHTKPVQGIDISAATTSPSSQRREVPEEEPKTSTIAVQDDSGWRGCRGWIRSRDRKTIEIMLWRRQLYSFATGNRRAPSNRGRLTFWKEERQPPKQEK